jgi:hypothetical protein
MVGLCATRSRSGRLDIDTDVEVTTILLVNKHKTRFEEKIHERYQILCAKDPKGVG